MTYTPDFDLDAARQSAGLAPLQWQWSVSFETVWRQFGLTESGLPKYIAEEVVNLKSGNTHHAKGIERWKGAHPREWALFVEPLYKQWKVTQEQPTQGTPLELIPVLSTPTVLQFKSLNITSAEQLLSSDDKIIERVTDGLRHRDAVKRFLEAGKKASEMSKVIRERDDLKEKVKCLEEEIKQINKKFKEFGEQKK